MNIDVSPNWPSLIKSGDEGMEADAGMVRLASVCLVTTLARKLRACAIAFWRDLSTRHGPFATSYSRIGAD